MSATSPSTVEHRFAYADTREHLSDEFALLDLLIRLCLGNREPPVAHDPIDQLRGLVLSEQEVRSLLDQTEDYRASKASAQTERRELAAAASALEAHIEARRAASLKAEVPLALSRLGHMFQLTRFEEQCLVVVLGPEVDRKYDKLYAYLHDDVTRKQPTVGLVFDLLCSSPAEKLEARALLRSDAPLVKNRLIEVGSAEGALPFLARSLKLDDRIAEFMLGYQDVDARIESLARLLPPTDDSFSEYPPDLVTKTRDFVRRYFARSNVVENNVVIHLRGPQGVGKRVVAQAAAQELGLPLVIGDMRRLSSAELPTTTALWLLAREACLQPAVLSIENFDELLEHDDNLQALMGAMEIFGRLTFLLGYHSWRPQNRLKDTLFVSLDLAIPDEGERAACWRSLAADYAGLEGADIGALASQFRFTPGQVRDVLDAAKDLTWWRTLEDSSISRDDLFDACRRQSSAELSTLAHKIAPRYGWADIVLQEDAMAQLYEMCGQARFRHQVFGEWGFDRKLSLGKGLSALFSGPPGTGKTMAAEVISGDLGLELYKIDLSQVVSKYIGETEKNLDRIFEAAERGNAILFFDEADALFGKRSEVRDSHDRYANVEVSFLLQKMDEHQGIAILATNLRQHMDEAFVRRLQVIVEFPFPDAGYRERIWRVTFPRQAPVDDDVNFQTLAREIKLAGGNIKNIVLAGAFYAAGEGGAIRMEHLRRAARREFQKLGRTWREPVGAEASQP